MKNPIKKTLRRIHEQRIHEQRSTPGRVVPGQAHTTPSSLPWTWKVFHELTEETV